MKINNFFLSEDNNNLELNWTLIEKIQQFDILKHTNQNTDWHQEGNVWNHTKLVTEAMIDILSSEDITEPIIKRCLVVAALCHDLGKAGHTKFDENDNQWHCFKHGFYGENVTRELLYDENIYLRETICALVTTHMIFHHIFDEGKEHLITDKLISLSWSNCPIYLHKLIYKADCLGSKNEFQNKEDIERTIQRIDSLCDEMKINSSPFEFETSNIYRFRRFLNVDINDSLLNDNIKHPELHLMIGLPGSGKDTYINNTLIREIKTDNSIIVLSRDEIRTEIGLVGEKPQGNKEQEEYVTEIFNNRYDYALENQSTIIINNTNVLKKYRNDFVSKAIQKGYEIIYHIVEAPDIRECKQRRTGMMSFKVIDRMKENFEFPLLKECNKIIIHKQRFDESHNVYNEDYIIDDYPIKLY